MPDPCRYIEVNIAKWCKAAEGKTERMRREKRNAHERSVDIGLDLLIAHHQHALLVPRYKHDALIRAGVQLHGRVNTSSVMMFLENEFQAIMVKYLIQAGEDMRHIDDGVPVLVDLMEDIIPEELDDIPVAGLTPSGITSKPKIQSSGNPHRKRGRKTR